MKRMIRLSMLAVMAMTLGFGAVYVVLTHDATSISSLMKRMVDSIMTVRVLHEPRRYVVNLTSGTEPIEFATMQHPDALARHQVYVHELTIKGTVWHQLRLGFFRDEQSAERVAASLRKEFPLARVATASKREWNERMNAEAVALVRSGAPKPAAKGSTTRPVDKAPQKQVLARAPTATRVALVSPEPALQAETRSQAGTPTQCDELSAHPWDPHKLTEGVYWNQVPAARAVLACRKAVRDDPSPRNIFQYGRALAKSKEFTEAVEWYHKAASQGYAQAQYALGDVYEFGEGVEVDYVMAQSWYKKAADQGYTHALSKIDRLKSAAITNTSQQMTSLSGMHSVTQ